MCQRERERERQKMKGQSFSHPFTMLVITVLVIVQATGILCSNTVRNIDLTQPQITPSQQTLSPSPGLSARKHRPLLCLRRHIKALKYILSKLSHHTIMLLHHTINIQASAQSCNITGLPKALKSIQLIF